MGRTLYWISILPIEDVDEGTDRWAMRHGLVSLTPLRLDLTDPDALQAARSRTPLSEATGASLEPGGADR
jgi:5'-nucleotidase